MVKKDSDSDSSSQSTVIGVQTKRKKAAVLRSSDEEENDERIPRSSKKIKRRKNVDEGELETEDPKSDDSINRRRKTANRKRFLKSSSEDEEKAEKEEPKVTRSAKRSHIPDEKTQKGKTLKAIEAYNNSRLNKKTKKFNRESGKYNLCIFKPFLFMCVCWREGGSARHNRKRPMEILSPSPCTGNFSSCI